ncbi:MAG: hypothetical protein JSW58_14105 [Candidatus Latescibacterota bacterium]|nr:MAG: hypothetical protein JSW58_14105 [Candidatus Latescibacterota bacterium]
MFDGLEATQVIIGKEKPLNRIKRFIRGQSGQDMVEFGLLAAFLSIIAVNVLVNFGPYIRPYYYKMQDAVRRAAVFNPGSGGSGSGKDLPGH